MSTNAFPVNNVVQERRWLTLTLAHTVTIVTKSGDYGPTQTADQGCDMVTQLHTHTQSHTHIHSQKHTQMPPSRAHTSMVPSTPSVLKILLQVRLMTIFLNNPTVVETSWY